jgi:hypothetical protein
MFNCPATGTLNFLMTIRAKMPFGLPEKYLCGQPSGKLHQQRLPKKGLFWAAL